MQGLLQFLVKNSSFLIFLLLEGISFYLVVNFNDEQQRIWLSTASTVGGTANKMADDVTNYFSLGDQVDVLMNENAALRERLHQLMLMQGDSLVGDSISREDLAVYLGDTTGLDTSKHIFTFIPANIINNSITAEDNILTLDKGTKDGVKEDMGVISSYGIVGVVLRASEHYSTVMSILHRQSRVSASIRRNGAFGRLRWRGQDSRYLYLEDVPRYEQIKIRDTVQTSGFSNIFPPNVLIGVVDTFYTDIREGGGNYHTIRVKLSNDIAKLQNAYIVVNKHYEELKAIEQQQPR